MVLDDAGICMTWPMLWAAGEEEIESGEIKSYNQDCKIGAGEPKNISLILVLNQIYWRKYIYVYGAYGAILW